MDKANKSNAHQNVVWSKRLSALWWSLAAVYGLFASLSSIGLSGIRGASPSAWSWVNLVAPALLQGVVVMSVVWALQAAFEGLRVGRLSAAEQKQSHQRAFVTHVTASTLLYVLWALTCAVAVLYQPLYLMLTAGWIGADIALRQLKRTMVVGLGSPQTP